MISLYDSKITDILPQSLKDLPEVKAISYAVANVNKKILNYAKQIALYAVVDDLSENILDLIAIEFRTQYYDENFDIEVKRNLIKNTLNWYIRLGTPYAVEELVKTIFGEGEVEEWFDYGGEPYRFRVTTNALFDPAGIENFFNMISAVKNTRSHLDGLNKHEVLKKKINVANALSITKHTKINMNEKLLEKELKAANALSITKIINVSAKEGKEC